MKIKKFMAPSMPLALDQVRENLGQDAVILSSRRVTKNLPEGQNAVNVEVTAGIEISSASAEWNLRTVPTSSDKEQKNADAAARINQLSQRISKSELERRHFSSATELIENTPETSHSSNKALDEDCLLSGMSSCIPDTASPKTFPDRTLYTDNIILSKLQELKTAINRMEEQSIVDLPFPVELQRMGDRLREVGLPERLVRNCMQKLFRNLENEALNDTEIVDSAAVEIISEWLPECRDIRISSKKRKIVAVVGAVGSGKTTAVAKIAAGFVNKLRRRRPNAVVKGQPTESRIVIISVDNQRVGAKDQLQAFAQLIGIKVEIAFDEEEFRSIVDHHHDAELILIDTPGWGPIDSAGLSELKNLFERVEVDEVHVVVDALSSAKNMKNVVEASSELGFDRRLFFSKLDCSDRVGTLLGLAEHSEIPLSYLSDSPSPPGGIKPGNLTDLVQRIVSGQNKTNRKTQLEDSSNKFLENFENNEVSTTSA